MPRPTEPKILLGLFDHLHQGWASLYPEGLPEDWRLAWYANEFSALLVPEHQWLEEKDFGAWHKETQDRLHWYLECKEVHKKRLEALHHQTSADFKLICQKVPDQATQEALKRLQITLLCPTCTNSPCWTQDPDSLAANDNCLCYLLKGDASLPLRQVRQILEHLSARSSAGRPAALLLEPGPHGLQNLEQCRELLRLMGLD